MGRVNPTRYFERILAAQANPKYSDANTSRRIAILDIALSAGVLTAIALGAMYFWISVPLAVLHFVTAVFFAALLTVLKVFQRPVLCARLGCCYLFLFLAIICWNLGALFNASIAWFVVIPIAAAIVIGIADAWFWIAATIFLAIGFYAANKLGIQPENIIAEDFRAFAYLCFFIALIFVVGVLISTWLAGQKLLETQLNSSLDETEEEAITAHVLASAATAANEGIAFDAAAKDCMRILCDALRWEAAQLWIRNDDGSLVPTSIAAGPETDALSPVLCSVDQIQRINGQPYLSEVVAETKTELIRTDLGGDPRADDARALNIRSVLLWPVKIDGLVDAVLEFFSREPVRIDERARQLVEHVALQLAHVRGREVARGRIEQLAYYDIVTGLPNRHAFERRFSVILDAAARRDTRVAVMFIDLDGFKHINDSLGHSAGDRLLHSIGEKLSENLRGSDFAMKFSPASSSMVARLGGDEFTVVLQDLQDLRGADVVARRFLDIISKPIDIGGHTVMIGASIGIAVYPDDATTRMDLLRLADAAMYEAKRATGNQYRFATKALNDSVQRRVWLENELRNAIEHGDVMAHFQPIAEAGTREICAYEALARWNVNGESVRPSEFIKLAEEIGVIQELGDAIIRQACEFAVRTNENRAYPTKVCANISPLQLRRDDFVDDVAAALRDTCCLPEWLTIELTESSLISDFKASAEQLHKLREIGVRVALDDFGTGYASLSYLRKFPLDYVKIDRSFIAGLGENPDDDAIIAAITTMAHTLQLEVVAEGIESLAQADRATVLGCDKLQGFLFGKAEGSPVNPGLS